ncbi:hypothetical protein DRW03_27395 [Corallococcus sp. H22C18031201]|uniref:EGF domain-containing protein n=1 Tax=Citreicoccus inhibens TaxID=2849499 RepID=UPI000E76E3A0|nr:EGF domain-containing protein [Citreicoccus inhibens]MBU8900835.1 hypothetical protein [Citreicoccus inhibens]RJS17713.1 hypothetical protein DRW03_27395 [Corallococcus sp. H22C18031201]
MGSLVPRSRLFWGIAALIVGVVGCGGDVCGDGWVTGNEACDDKNRTSGDGCDSNCAIEAGFTCTQCPVPSGGLPSFDGGASIDLSQDEAVSQSSTVAPGVDAGLPCKPQPSVCTDIDECANGTAHCDFNALCTNTPGHYTCTCKDGYSGDGITCTDIDECATGTSGCSPNALCTNTPGAFVCTCKLGYSGDGITCTDIDECANGTALCLPGQTCTNTPGSYECKYNVCLPPLISCGGTCVDPRSDPNHCGTCTTACTQNQSCVGSVCVGMGNLQFNVTWSRAGDGDLLVVTPSGKVISYVNPGPNAATDFGRLDRDDQTGTGPENVFWDVAQTPPAGTYNLCFNTSVFFPLPTPATPVDIVLTARRPGKAPVVINKHLTESTVSVFCGPLTPNFVGSYTLP